MLSSLLRGVPLQLASLVGQEQQEIIDMGIYTTHVHPAWFRTNKDMEMKEGEGGGGLFNHSNGKEAVSGNHLLIIIPRREAGYLAQQLQPRK